MTDYRFISPDGVTTDYTLRTDFIAGDVTTGNLTVCDIYIHADPSNLSVNWQKIDYAVSDFAAFATANSLTLIATTVGGNNADDAEVSTVITGPTLATPGSFAAASTITGENDLSWTVSANAQEYQIDRATNAGFTTGVALDIAPNLVGTSTSYSDPGLVSGTTYYYRIKAQSSYALDSAYATANVTTH